MYRVRKNNIKQLYIFSDFKDTVIVRCTLYLTKNKTQVDLDCFLLFINIKLTKTMNYH